MNNKHKNFHLYIIGRLISQIGSGIQMIAIPLYILDTTGSGFFMGIFAMLSIAPSLITSPLSGVLGDRHNRKKIMVYSDFSRGIFICLLAVMSFSGKFSIPLLFTMQVLLSILDSLFDSSSDGILPELVKEEHLTKANASKGAVDSFSMIMGPILGGIIYGFSGVGLVFFINATSFIISSVLHMFIVYKWHSKNENKLSARVFMNDINEVLLFIFKNRGLKQLFTFTLINNFLFVPIFVVIIPFAFKKVIGFSSQQYGFLQTFSMIGLLIGNIGVGVFFEKTKPKKLIISGMLLQTLTLIVFGIILLPSVGAFFHSPSWRYFLVLGFSIAMMGVVNPLVNVPIQTNLQKMVSNDMRSRFFSILVLLAQLIVPVGSFIFGILLDIIPVYIIIISIDIIVFLVTLFFILVASDEVYSPVLSEDVNLINSK